MAKFAKMLNNKGKGSKSEVLPSRHALNRLAGGEPWERSMGNYAKSTPSGEEALDAPSIMNLLQTDRARLK
jgi:hypothetical protein